jgi:hypothetical protein
MTDRAVSEALSFVLVFSIVTLTVGIVYVGGFASLQDARDAERFENAERAFDVLADNLEDTYRDGAPSRATELKLADASIGFGSETEVSVAVDGDPPVSVALDPIVYDAGTGRTLAYENGAVVRSEGDTAFMIEDPEMVFDADEDLVVVPIVQTRPTGDTSSLSGQSTVLVRTQLMKNGLLSQYDSGPHSVELDVTTTPARAEAWERYLSPKVSAMGGSCNFENPDDSKVSCSVTADTVYVSAARLDVSLF